MRIAIVDTSDFAGYPMGGATKVIEGFLGLPQAADHDIRLFGLTRDRHERVGGTYTRVVGARAFSFTPVARVNPGRGAKPGIPLRIQFLVGSIMGRRHIVRWQPDAIYAHHPEALPLLLFQRATVAFHFHTALRRDMHYARYAVARSRAAFLPIVLFERLILAVSSLVLSVDQDALDLYGRLAPTRTHRFHLLPPVLPRLPTSDPAAGPPPPFRQPGPHLLYAGRLSDRKGLPLIFAAVDDLVARGYDPHLVIVGDGESAGHVARWTLETRARVSSVGYMPHEALGDVFAAADVTLFASHYESFGLVVVESLAAGTPVVSTMVGIAPEVIRPAVNGYLVEDRDYRRFADGICDTLASPSITPESCRASVGHLYSPRVTIFDLLAKTQEQL